MSNEKKSATLGMPHGTAAHRLRKNILFHLLERHGENVCARCGELILSVEELSIEHIKPWEGISAELFWDLKNIAFSHLHCNSGARRISNKIETPVGTGWCSTCKSFKPIDDFHKGVSRDGLQRNCKSCKREKRMSGDWSNGRASELESRSGL